eukprot:SAG31_NODE_18236_length_642_cov_1.403315_1_plen_155_part_01
MFCVEAASSIVRCADNGRAVLELFRRCELITIIIAYMFSLPLSRTARTHYCHNCIYVLGLLRSWSLVQVVRYQCCACSDAAYVVARVNFVDLSLCCCVCYLHHPICMYIKGTFLLRPAHRAPAWRPLVGRRGVNGWRLTRTRAQQRIQSWSTPSS